LKLNDALPAAFLEAKNSQKLGEKIANDLVQKSRLRKSNVLEPSFRFHGNLA